MGPIWELRAQWEHTKSHVMAFTIALHCIRIRIFHDFFIFLDLRIVLVYSSCMFVLYFISVYILELLVKTVWDTVWDFSACRWRAHSIFYLSYFLLCSIRLWYLLSTRGPYSTLLHPFGADPSTSTSHKGWDHIVDRCYFEVLDHFSVQGMISDLILFHLCLYLD